MPNSNAFFFQIGEKTCYADPLFVRRVLLNETMGKCWGITRKITRLREDVKKWRNEAQLLEAGLEAEPTSPEEMTKIAELQKERAEGKQGTLPFNELPRVYKLEGYENQIAICSNQIAELEGVLANAAYKAFDLPPLNPDDGSGVTEHEVIEILKAYLDYAEGKGERLGS